MINANVVFWIFVALFGLTGWMRGWQKEIIATTSLVLGIFAMNFANLDNRLTNLIQPSTQGNQRAAPSLLRGRSALLDSDRVKLDRFAIQAAPFLLIAFFGYLGPTVARQVGSGRFNGKDARVGIEQGILGAVPGAMNGYAIISTLAYFAYRQQMLPDQGTFPLVVQGADPPTTILFEPLKNGVSWATQTFIEWSAFNILQGPLLIGVLIVLFLFVIIVFI